MTIIDFLILTKARIGASTPEYFKKLRTWFQWAVTAAGSVTGYALTNPNFSISLEAHHIITYCHYIIAVGLTGIGVASAAVKDPATLAPPISPAI